MNIKEKLKNDIFRKKLYILIISLIGFITTIKLAIIYYNANFNPYALSSFCSINEFIDCDTVARTADSQFVGIPLAYWGMFLYLFIILMLFVSKLKEYKLFRFLEVFKNPLAYVAVLGLIAFAISILLACISIFQIKKICILCVFTYVLNLIISLIAVDFKNGGYLQAFKQSVTDFVDAIKVKQYLIAFIVVVITALGFLIYTGTSYVFAPHVKRIKAIKPYLKMSEKSENPFRVTGNLLGDENAEVVIHVYSDYGCPICSVHDIIIHRAIKELSNVKVVHHNFPLDVNCNNNIQLSMHPNACVFARYSIAAEKQGKLWDMHTLMFENRPKDPAMYMTEDGVLNLAKNLGLNIEQLKKDAYSAETTKLIDTDIAEAVDYGINGTPAMILNGKLHMGILPYYELKKILLEAGAKERKNAK